MPRRDPRIDAYIKEAAPFAEPILTRLRDVVHKGCPDVEETMKWRFPHFDYKGMFCSMAAFKRHVTFTFWKGTLLEAKGLAKADEKAMGQFGRIASLVDLPGESALIRLVQEAARLNDDGVKVERRRTKKPPVKVPGFFVAALRKNKTAFAAFDAFSPSHRREYVQWVTEAKTEETRERRMKKAIAQIAERKSQNWRYEK